MSKIIGNKYEYLAKNYLIKLGYSIIKLNYYCKYGEVDIIALDFDKVLCFIEVKSRKSRNFGSSLEMVSASKQAKIIKTSQNFLIDNQIYNNYEMKFDVIGFDTGKLTYISAAFYC